MVRSPEQGAIVDRVVAGDSLDILAYAGTGKTSLCLECATALPRRRVLYAAFNAHNAREAKSRFGKAAPHVRVSTYHGLAFGPLGSRYADAGRLVSGPWQVRRAIVDRFGEALQRAMPRSRFSAMVYAVIDGLRTFCQSADPGLDGTHLPVTFSSEVESDELQAAVELMRRVWSAMCSLDDDFPVTHDFYFKRWTMGKPRLNYDVVLIDERQDLDPAMLALMRSQGTQLVFVGDVYQSLYRFRGAIGSAVDLKLPRMPLTHSWRFGPEIAGQADSILQVRGAPYPLIGAGAPGRVVLHGAAPKVVLCRSNVGVVMQAIAWMDHGKKVGIVGSAAEVAEAIEGAYDLYVSGSSNHPRFRTFESWAVMVEAASTKQGQEMRPFVKLITSYGGRIPQLVSQIKGGTVPLEAADIVVATVHKFKGMEAESVLLGDDFPPFVYEVDGRLELDEDEANVGYVALTRARSELQLGGFSRPLRESLALLKAGLSASASRLLEYTLSPKGETATARTTRSEAGSASDGQPSFGLWAWDAAS